MSAYAHQMEREFSAQSLSSRGGSVMLQSCQNSIQGVLETQKLSGVYGYCKTFEQHAELNSLGPDDLPPMCRILANQQAKEGQYERDLNTSLWLVERYFESVVPSKYGLDAMLIDVDDILATDLHYTYPFTHRLFQYGCSGGAKVAKHLKERLFLRLYMKLQASGWSLILLSRKPQKQQNGTIEHLISAGYRGWSSLPMRLDEEMAVDSQEYFSRKRMEMQKKGFRISSVISSQMDALTGASLGERVFKFPNPTYYFYHHRENT